MASRLPRGEGATAIFSNAVNRASASSIQAGGDGEWIEAAELRQWAMEQIESSFERLAEARGEARTNSTIIPETKLVLDLKDLHYLEASALQVALAIAAEQHRLGRRLQFANVSEELCRWFELFGAGALFEDERESETQGETAGETTDKFVERVEEIVEDKHVPVARMRSNAG
jgi:anti-anti-sigma regulatory factor